MDIKNKDNNNNQQDYYSKTLQHIIDNYIIKKETNDNKENDCIVIGLGSGSTVGRLVRKIGELPNKDSFGFIPTSIQIKIIGEERRLRFLDESWINDLDLVIDGADQIDENLNLIKGGGGALLKEKILMYSAKQRVILADSKKFVTNFHIPVPIEVHPFARFTAINQLQKAVVEVIEGFTEITKPEIKSKIRVQGKGYPIVTENGNIILDTEFNFLNKIKDMEKFENLIKNIPGVIEVGIFPRKKNTICYSVNEDGTFSIRKS